MHCRFAKLDTNSDGLLQPGELDPVVADGDEKRVSVNINIV